MSVPYPRVAEPGDADEPSDTDLIARVRAGSGDAYGLLYERHLAAARRLARQLSRSPADGEDLVAEAFAKTFAQLRAGGGPTTAFRAYLLTAMRNTWIERGRRDSRLRLYDDLTPYEPVVPWVDPAVAGLDSTLAARAFAQLPERWQAVLWHTEVEEESPADVAPLLGLSPNAVAALAYRAREGLRQAYLREHLDGQPDGEHRWTVERLGTWARGGLARGPRAKVDEHLAGCDRCRVLAAEVREVNGSLRGLVAPVVLGAALAPAYLASVASETAAAAGSIVGWLAGTTAGKVAAGAAAATVVAGAVVGVGLTDRSPDPPATAAPAAAGPTAGPTAGRSEAASSRPGRDARPATPPSPPPGRTSAAPPTPRPPVASSPPPPPPPAGGRSVTVGAPAAVRPLRQGRPGEIGVPVRNPGPAAATDLVATVSLPVGLTVRAGNSNSPADWHCVGTGRVARCEAARLPAGGDGTFRVKVFVARDAAPGTVGGSLTGAGLSAAIPATTIQIEPR